MNSPTALALYELEESVRIAAEIIDEDPALCGFGRFVEAVTDTLYLTWPLDQLGNTAIDIDGTTVYVGLWDSDGKWVEVEISLENLHQIIFREFCKYL